VGWAKTWKLQEKKGKQTVEQYEDPQVERDAERGSKGCLRKKGKSGKSSKRQRGERGGEKEEGKGRMKNEGLQFTVGKTPLPTSSKISCARGHETLNKGGESGEKFLRGKTSLKSEKSSQFGRACMWGGGKRGPL